MLPGFDVCGECGGKGVLGGCRQPCDHVHTFMFCPVCSGVGSVPADATVQAVAQGLHLATRIPRAGSQFWHTEARAALVAYAQTVKEN